MKINKIILSGLAIFSLLAIAVSSVEKPAQTKSQAAMPENVKKIVDNKCFGCHNTDSKNDDAKEKLDFKTLDDLNKFKKIGKLRDIAEVLEKDKMPPKKFLERFPDKDLTDEESKILYDWVKSEAASLIESQQ